MKPSSVLSSLQAACDLHHQLIQDTEFLNQLSELVDTTVAAYQNGGKLLIAGNGGSAADAQHFAGEIEAQFLHQRAARPALALTTNSSTVTAWANDHEFSSVFARLIEAHGSSGDAVFLISTSGNSENLLMAAEAARLKGLPVLGLLGCGGGALATLCDQAVVVPSDETPRIQEVHILCIHIICEALDRLFVEMDGI